MFFVIKHFFAITVHFSNSLSFLVTTRPQQEGEIPGQDYHFVSIQEFHSLCRKDFFLEWAENSDGEFFEFLGCILYF
jgi:guanylate kinase